MPSEGSMSYIDFLIRCDTIVNKILHKILKLNVESFELLATFIENCI